MTTEAHKQQVADIVKRHRAHTHHFRKRLMPLWQQHAWRIECEFEREECTEIMEDCLRMIPDAHRVIRPYRVDIWEVVKTKDLSKDRLSGYWYLIDLFDYVGVDVHLHRVRENKTVELHPIECLALAGGATTIDEIARHAV